MAVNRAAIAIAALVLMVQSAGAQDAVVKGTATLRGEAPKAREITKNGFTALDESVLVDLETGGLRNVFVWVKGGGKLPRPGNPAEVRIDLIDRQFRPRVSGVAPRQKIVFVSGDEHTFCVHGVPAKSKEFNVTLHRKGESFDTSFGALEEAVRVKDDMCVWMTTWFFVLDHAHFAVTDDKGAFALPSLPPGEYEIAAWHEVYGYLPTRKVALKGTDAKHEFVFEKK